MARSAREGCIQSHPDNMARKALEISYVGLTDKNVEQLRKLNTVLFPVRYSDKFYSTDVLKPEHADVSKLGALALLIESFASIVDHSYTVFTIQFVTTMSPLALCAADWRPTPPHPMAPRSCT
jgi:hypothetical protein